MESINYSERVKTIRKLKNLNKNELSKTLGVSSGYISEIEQGKKMPGLNFIVSLRRELNVSVDWFITGEGDPFRDQKYQTKDPVIEEIVGLLEKVSDRNKNQILDYIKERKLLADLMDRDKSKGYC